MKIYNTLSAKKEEFVPIEDGKIKMYVCGPTVYDYIHIGNARPYVIYDSLRRYFEYKGYDVTFIQNFTDIDDKIIKKANDENVDFMEISNRYIKAALEDTERLGVREATINPRVTNEVPEIIEMIQTLIDKGYAYERNGSVYFETPKFKDYGKLSHKIIEDLEAGARIEVDDEKKNPSDFILWKPKKDGEPYWDSPWSQGRPGWHIECSVMAKKYLGDTIDIHAGGEDLIFPHHENEIAQSESANGKNFANYWMHNGFINIDNKKMSKSKGNFFTVRDVLEKYDPDVFRFFILSSHYRSPVNFSEELVKSSENGLERLKTTAQNLEFIMEKNKDIKITDEERELLKKTEVFKEGFEKMLEDDFNTAGAIGSIFELAKFININSNELSSKEFAESLLSILEKLTDVLGISIRKETLDENEEIEKLIEQRTEARKNKNWAEADEIRDKLTNMGIVLEDTPLGVRWSRK